MPKTSTSSFGTSKREAHDSSSFYKRNLYSLIESKAIIDPNEPVNRPPILKDWFDLTTL
jgi:hypothetical protein